MISKHLLDTPAKYQSVRAALRHDIPLSIFLFGPLTLVALFLYIEIVSSSNPQIFSEFPARSQLIASQSPLILMCIVLIFFRRIAPNLLTTVGLSIWFVCIALDIPNPLAVLTIINIFIIYTCVVWGHKIWVALIPVLLGFEILHLLVMLTGADKSLIMHVGIQLWTLVICIYGIALIRRLQLNINAANKALISHIQQQNEANSQAAIIAERTHIAREMHDLLAHSLAVIIAQADGAKYAAKNGNTEITTQALEVIRNTGRRTIIEVRKIITLLRTPQGTPMFEMSEQNNNNHLEPISNQAELPLGSLKPDQHISSTIPLAEQTNIRALVNEIRKSGIHISFLELGTPPALSTLLKAALFRICQEALTNTLKYVGTKAKVNITLKYQPNSVSLSISDDGKTPPSTQKNGRGHGITGMKERANQIGGWLNAHWEPTVGFVITSEFPLKNSEMS